MKAASPDMSRQPRVYPIPIREDVVVRVYDLPPDLTGGEAEKIAQVVRALANKGER